MEAAGHRAAQETRADGPSCTGLQGPAAEGGRDVHPHLRCSHERPHNEPNTTQPGAGGCICVCVFCAAFNASSPSLSVSCRDCPDVPREWLGVVLCGGSSGRCVKHAAGKRSKSNPQERV